MNEVSPANDYCQRWTAHLDSWRHVSEGGFDKRLYDIRPVDELTAKRYTLEHHYSASYPSASWRFGIFEGDLLLGVCVLGTPAGPKVLTNVFPDLEPSVQSTELNRLCLADSVPANAETWMMGQIFSELRALGVKGVVSFSDPMPRVVNGRQLFPGHIGIIYQAASAWYCGRATARSLTLLPDGTAFNDRSKQKVRKQERGHEHVERKLIALGAPVMRAGEPPALWLKRAMDTIDITTIRHPGNHRYVFPIGGKRVRVAKTPEQYPKVRDAA